jgi:hypothetical protein
MSRFLEFNDFPWQDTLGGGLYQATEHYLGRGADRLFFGRVPSRPDDRYLLSISSVTSDGSRAVEANRDKLLLSAPGVFTPVFVGHFDVLGEDPPRDRFRTHEYGFVERLPEGGPLSRLLPAPRAHAVELGCQIGLLLQGAVAAGVLVVGLRPEYVWVRVDGPTPVVTGIGGRNSAFFGAAGRGRDLPTARLFTHRYTAPEAGRGASLDDRALVLTLAVMVAEWATGEYPYPMDDGQWGYYNLVDGKHRELRLSAELARLLSLGMRPLPGDRPDLRTFTERLQAIRDEETAHSLG